MKQRSFRRQSSADSGDAEWLELGPHRQAEPGTGAATPARGRGPVYVVDDGTSRCLHFGPDYVQSRMEMNQPFGLPLGYTRLMMAFLLFSPMPRDVLIVGLGGGSLTKYCYRNLPRSRITTLEINPQVIELASTFDVPPADERMRIIHADAVDYFAGRGARADVILLDGCDDTGIDQAFSNEHFYQSVRDGLRHRGVLAANLVGTAQVREAHAGLIAETFEQRAVVVPVAGEPSKVAFAFRDTGWRSNLDSLPGRARKLERKFGLDFPAFARSLLRASERSR